MRLGSAWTILVFPGGAHYHGIPPESMQAVMNMSRVPQKDREAMLVDLQAMEAAARPVLNEKQ